MVLNDPLANVLSHMLNCERLGRKECVVKPSSKMIKAVLTIMQNHKYIGEFTEVIDNRGNLIKINLIGKINNAGVIKPRFNVKGNEYIKFEKRFLPARGFGVLIVSTSKGIMTHSEAKEKNLGGKLVSYCY